MESSTLGAKNAVDWVESSGGPLVLVPCRHASEWRGIETSDYLEACAVDGYLGVVSRTWADVIVLGDEALRTTAIARGADVLLVRWLYAPSSDVLTEAARGFRAPSRRAVESTRISFLDEPYVIIDSAAAGDRAPGVSVSIPAGLREINTFVVNDVRDVAFVVHQIF